MRTLALVLVALAGASCSSRKSPPILTDAVALGSLVSVDSHRDVASIRARCVWRITPKRRLAAGLWRVRLRGVSLVWEAGGAARAVTLREWERLAKRHGWQGTLRLSRRGPVISNGPTTDVCAGVLG